MNEITTDTALLRRYADEKSEAAFAELVRRHLDLVYSAALRRLGGDAHRAADIAQQVFTTLARDAASLSRHGVLTAWLYTATRNAAIDLVRSEQRRHTREQEASTMQNLFSSTPDADWERLRPVLDRVMDELSDADRTAVLLRFFEKRPFADIGAALDLTEDAARMRVDRALEKLRALLARHGVTSTAVALTAALANQVIVAAPAGLAATITGTALTGATTTAAVAAGYFMNTTTALISAVAIAAGGFSIYEVNQASRAEIALAALGGERDGLRTQLRTGQQRLAATEQRDAALQDEVETLRASQQAPVAPRANSGGTSGPAALELKRAEEEKQLKAVAGEIQQRLASRMQTFDFDNRAVYRALNFTPEQAAQFKALNGEFMQRQKDLVESALAQGSGAADGKPFMLRLDNPAAAADLANQLRSTFGEAAYHTIQHFNDTAPVRPLVEQLASTLYYTDTPLTVPQAEQLVELLARNARNAEGRVNLNRLDTATALAQAQAMLSAPQFEAARQIAAKVEAERQSVVAVKGSAGK